MTKDNNDDVSIKMQRYVRQGNKQDCRPPAGDMACQSRVLPLFLRHAVNQPKHYYYGN